MADKEIFSLAMDNLEDFPVDLDSNDDNFNVDLNNEDQNFNLDTAQEDEDFTVDFGEVINLGTTDYERLQHLPQINGVTLIGNKTTEDLGISTDSSYDASWLFGAIDSTATQAQYNELYQAIQDKVRIVVSTEGQTFNAQAYMQDSNNVSVIINVGTISEYDGTSYAQNVIGIFSVDGQTKSVSFQVGETDGSILAEDIANLSSSLSTEVTNRQNADNNLQNQIDAITVSSDVVDVLGTYAELQQYDTSHLKDNDIVKVLQDSTHSNAMSYYRWVISGGTGSFQYIGSEGPFYTKGEVDTKVNTNLGGQSFTTVQPALETLISEFTNALDTKQNEITPNYKLASDLVDDTNQSNKFVTSQEKTTWNNKSNFSGDYSDLTNKASITYTGTTIDNRIVTQTPVTETIDGTKLIGTYGPFNFIPLDMSSYTSGTGSKALLPAKHLPYGVYVVTDSGYMRLGTETKKLEVGSLIYWFDSGELDLIGYNACEYWSYDSQNDEWSGGYFTTHDDVEYIVTEKVGWTINNSTLVAGTANMTDGRWSRRTRATGVNSLTIAFPSELPEYNYKSKLTCRTSSAFTTFSITARDYDIYFYGDDCVDGVLTGVADKYYEMEASHDGFEGLLVKVHSHALPTT